MPENRPQCQVADCFEPASVYVVVTEKGEPGMGLNAFKLILHLCARHDYDFKYLLGNDELGIVKRRHLALKESSLQDRE